MPANLNALIRYKTINACLTGYKKKWTMEELIDACSEALGEYRGIYKRISKRTIQDDIRIMRSEILGFNAPLEYGDGTYFYSDAQYSIFNITITDEKLLSTILEILLLIRGQIAHPELEMVINRLSNLTSGDGICEDMVMPAEAPPVEKESRMYGKPGLIKRSFKIKIPTRRRKAQEAEVLRESIIPAAFNWQEIFNLI